MKRLIIFLLCLYSFSSTILANENANSTDDITQRINQVTCDNYKITLLAYKQICEDTSQDTVYAKLLSEYGSLCFNAYNYETAIEATFEATEIYKSVYGVNHTAYLSSLLELVSLHSLYTSVLFQQENYMKAIEQGAKALAIYNKKILHKDNSKDASIILLILANSCFFIKDYEKTIEYGTQIIEMYNKKLIDKDNSLFFRLLTILISSFYHIKDYEKTIEYGIQATEMYNKKLIVEDNSLYASLLPYLAYSYYELGDYLNTIEYGKQVTEMHNKKLIDEDDSSYVLLFEILAHSYYEIGDYERTIEYGTQVTEMYEKKLINEDNSVYTALSEIISCCYNHLGNYSKAIEIGSKIAYDKRALIDETTLNASFIALLADSYSHLNDYEKAIEIGKQALEVNRIVFGEDDPSYISVLEDIAYYYSNNGNYANAIQYAGYYFEQGNYKKAIDYCSQALDIYKKNDGENDPRYAIALSNLALYYSLVGDYTKSIQLGNKALEIKKIVLNTEDIEYANSLTNLAYSYGSIGKYEKAIELETEALEIRKHVLDTDNSNYAISLLSLSSFYAYLDNYPEAIRLGREAVEIMKKNMDNLHPDYAKHLSNLAMILYYSNNDTEALRMETEAMEIRKKTLGVEHPDYAESLHHLSMFFNNRGYHSYAIALETQAIEICKHVLGECHPKYASYLNGLAQYLVNTGEYENAIKLGHNAVEIYQTDSGKNPLGYALSLRILSSCYYYLGDYVKGIEFETQSMEIYKHVLGEQHPDYAKSLSNLSIYYLKLFDFKKAADLFSLHLNSLQSSLFRNLSGMSSQSRTRYWQKHYFDFQSYPNFMNYSNDIVGDVYDKSCLFSKGLLLTTETDMRKLILESGDSNALDKYEQLQSIRMWLNKIYEMPTVDRTESTDSLEQVVEHLETDLLKISKAYGDFMHSLKLTWQDVQSKLNNNDIAIEFLSFPLFDSKLTSFSDTTLYIALTVRKGYDSPHWVVLFDDKELHQLTGRYYESSELSELVWRPMESELEGIQNIYFSPSGELYNIAIESLPHWSDTCLISDRFNLYRLSSTRELVTHQPSQAIGSATTNAVIFGGIDYDATYASIEKSEPQYVKDYYAMNTERGQHQGRFDYRSLQRYGVGPLPGSNAELKEIFTMLKQLHANCDTLSGIQASEESFKALSGQRKSLLHISTHGFYYTPEETENLNEHLQRMLIGNDRPTHVEDQSLLRCGLCLAGANQTLSGESQPSEGQGDGILNALEIAQTDLRGLDLVVLSACQTALGDVVNGEGVFGLQRGFKKAGAQSILMSLWNIDDKITRIFMTEFYRAWTSGMTKTAALKCAQSKVKSKYPDPHHWAAFILLDALD